MEQGREKQVSQQNGKKLGRMTQVYHLSAGTKSLARQGTKSGCIYHAHTSIPNLDVTAKVLFRWSSTFEESVDIETYLAIHRIHIGARATFNLTLSVMMSVVIHYKKIFMMSSEKNDGRVQVELKSRCNRWDIIKLTVQYAVYWSIQMEEQQGWQWLGRAGTQEERWGWESNAIRRRPASLKVGLHTEPLHQQQGVQYWSHSTTPSNEVNMLQ